MLDGQTADLVGELADEVSLWCTTPDVGQLRIVELACEALVVGLDGPAMVDLACQSTHGMDWNFYELMGAAMQEQGRVAPLVGALDAQRGALRAMARRLLAGLIGERELARWAHAVIGHSGIVDGQTLVEIDDEYDTAEFVRTPPESWTLGDRVRTEADRLLADWHDRLAD